MKMHISEFFVCLVAHVDGIFKFFSHFDPDS